MILPSRERISHPDLQGQLDDVIPDYRAWLDHRGLGPLQDGESVDMEIGNFGKLSVKIVDAMKREWVKETHAEREAREAAAR